MPRRPADGARLPVRVAVLDHTAEPGGAELALVRLLEALDPAEFDVRVVLFSDGPLRAILQRAGRAVDVVPLAPHLAAAERHNVGRSVLASTRAALAAVPFVWRLARHVRSLDVDVVHTTSLKADLLGTSAAWLIRRPLVWHVHDRIAPDYLPRPLVALVRGLARFAPRHVIVNSRATAETLPGVRRLSVAPPGLAPEQVAARPRRTAHDGARDDGAPDAAAPVVGLLGRISPTKGQLEFVRAAALVARRHPAARFRVIGAPMFGQEEYAARVRAEIAALGLTERMEVAGFTADPTAALDALAVCVHASPTPEPFGQVVAEAMARGVPVVATRGGGVTEIVEPEPGAAPLGRLVPPGDVPALAEAISATLDDPAEAAAWAERAWASVHERFPIARTAAVVGAVWHAVADGQSTDR